MAVVCILYIASVVAVPMPFRIGLELQMSGELCKWAISDYSVQKQAIMSC
jgi:hypothetical protein